MCPLQDLGETSLCSRRTNYRLTVTYRASWVLAGKVNCRSSHSLLTQEIEDSFSALKKNGGGGGGGFTRPIPRDGGADQFREIPIVGRLPTDGTRGPEEKECGRKWPDAEGLVQGNRARDVRDPVVQNHSCCKKESRLDQPCGDKS